MRGTLVSVEEHLGELSKEVGNLTSELNESPVILLALEGSWKRTVAQMGGNWLADTRL